MAHDSFECTAQDITCREVVDWTSAYLDEHVGDPVKVRLALHLSICAGCGTYVKQIASIRNLLGLLPGVVEEPARRDRLHGHSQRDSSGCSRPHERSTVYPQDSFSPVMLQGGRDRQKP